MPALRDDVCNVLSLRSHPAVKEPEWRALEQIVAEARADGRQVVVLGPEGVFEIAAGAAQASPTMGATEK